MLIESAPEIGHVDFDNWISKFIGLFNTHRIYSGNASPESVLSANVGSLFLRSDGGANTTLYIKESGTGNTGWVAK